MEQSSKQMIHYTVGEEPEFKQIYRISQPRHTYHTLVVLLLGFLVAIVLLQVPFQRGKVHETVVDLLWEIPDEVRSKE